MQDTPPIHEDSAANSSETEQDSCLCFCAQPADDLSRLDKFLADKLRAQGFSREKLKEWIHSGKVWVNDLPASSPRQGLFPGSRVRVDMPEPSCGLSPEEGEICVLYRDAVVAVLNKAPGITVHPAPGRPTGTLAHRLLAYFPELAAQEGFRPGIVHRLDKDTSGLMLVALTEKCRLALAQQFAQRAIHKEYLALVHGVPQKSFGDIEAPIGRHPRHKTRMAVLSQGRNAKSSWRVLYADPSGRFSLLCVRIFSGRTHQVRVHMQYLGHPLWGDAVYTGQDALLRDSLPNAALSSASPRARAAAAPTAVFPVQAPQRQMLHAWKLAFAHPGPFPDVAALPSGVRHEQGVLSFCCPPPADFTDAVRSLSLRMQRVIVTGSPGCGKSSLLSLLQQHGFPVFSADAKVAALYAPGQDGHRLLRSHFAERFVPHAQAPVDKAALGAAMLQSDSLRREVEALLHPLVWRALEEFWRTEEKAGRVLGFAEIPLYLESGQKTPTPAYDPAPVLVGVECPFPIREKRLLQNRGWAKERIARMESWQWPEEKKMQACDLRIANTGGMEELRAGIALLLRELEKRRERRILHILDRVETLWDCKNTASPLSGSNL